LWSQDELSFQAQGRALSVRVELSEESQAEGEVIAERPIDEVSAYANKLLNADTSGALASSRLHLLFKHSQQLGQSADLNATLSAASALVFDLLPRATHVAIALREELSSTEGEPTSSSDKRRARAPRFPVMHASQRSGGQVERPMSKTLIKRVVSERKALLLMDASNEVGGVRSVLAAGLSSVMLVPLWVGADICGVLQVDNRDKPSVFGAEELELLMVGASTISFATESARLISRLRVAEEQLKGGLSYLQNSERKEASGLIGESEGMRAITQSIERVKDLKVPVFIKGETGTGKELIARALHYQSARHAKLFVAQNCGALPEGILESELFGHTKGAFTGADRDKKGLFELADGGTIFLDEIGEMPHTLQSKLLRVLQEGEVWPLGASRPKQVDVRVLSATHRDLDEMVSEGSFRQDLYYRLHVYPIHLPPLRERGGDITLLAQAFLTRYAREFGRGVSGLSEEAQRALTRYSWPGNVRELQNEIQRALISRFEGDLILLEDLSPHISGVEGASPDVVREALGVQGTLKEMMEHLERALLERALEEHNNNKTQTAKALGITREGLHKKLNRLSLTSPEEPNA
jgi:Nif-specific regulatory protein